MSARKLSDLGGALWERSDKAEQLKYVRGLSTLHWRYQAEASLSPWIRDTSMNNQWNTHDYLKKFQTLST
ncbi:hypothetical protein [Xenorhabdus bovienii]|uniref:hypothetical protein n=1 Tax=Xenorhabdus bovienii TaxID=40576 RepID=UPI0023B264C1|nr:hypothetical protein [Xenorhabdus bovienii]MDE9536895.1 hypothetical protein [Xenorhabdus bovienii]MDE9589833.1 hypothetical protein [Xenorhabdus bovienii]